MPSLLASKKDNEFVSVSRNLKYHNQFVLGPYYIQGLTDWQRIEVTPSILLMTHPDLNTYQTQYASKSLTLVGYILDPDKPQSCDADIVNALIVQLSECDRFVAYTYKYGGRWILIMNDGKEVRLFNDAAGLRQVFYTEKLHTKELWCASQPKVIAELLNLEKDKEAVEFIDSYKFRKNPEFRFPGDGSPYREIKHLLPNHYLNLETGQCKRFWPDKPLSYLSFNEAVGSVSSTLQGLMQSAANRFDLALSITAGLDSRVVLAASKAIKDLVSYMTVRQIGMPDNHPDVATPSQLLTGLNLKHEVVRSSLIIDDEFIEIFKRNVSIPHYIYAADAQAILNYYTQSKVAVTGSVSEVCRSSFRAKNRYLKNKDITIKDFARLQQMGMDKYALDHFNHWLLRTGELYNLHILSLFEWELDDGNWLAMCQLEFDIAWKDIFTPFNCRNLIKAMWSVKQEYMWPPEYQLYKAVINELWPEVLSVPINPHKDKKTGFLSKIRSFARKRLTGFIYR
jgi:hypothetical protein